MLKIFGPGRTAFITFILVVIVYSVITELMK